MRSGSVLEVWADGYTEVGDDLVFGVLATVTAEQQPGLRIISRTPSDESRVVVELARVPRVEVEQINGG
jgi:hypothetical protein